MMMERTFGGHSETTAFFRAIVAATCASTVAAIACYLAVVLIWFVLGSFTVASFNTTPAPRLHEVGLVTLFFMTLFNLVITGIFLLIAGLMAGAVTLPATFLVGGIAYALFRITPWMTPINFASGGFGAGALIWTLVFAGAPPGAFFGSWWAALAVGGVAGAAAGFVFAKRMAVDPD